MQKYMWRYCHVNRRHLASEYFINSFFYIEENNMKKILLGTSALVAAGVISSAAHASEPVKLEVGGYMDWWVAAIDQKEDYETAAGIQGNNVDVFGNGEIHFKGSTTLDNGIKVGVQVELEGGNRSESDPIDESYVTVDSQYGRLVIGSDDNVAYSMHVSAPDVGRLGIEESYLTEDNGMTSKPTAAAGFSQTVPMTTALAYDNDAQKITYITPTFSGLTAGVSYIPGTSDLTGEDTTLATASNLDDGYAAGLTFSQDISGAGVTVSGGYAEYDTKANDNRTEYSVGVNVAVDAFTVGGAYRNIDDNNTDGQAWNIGVAWEQGPYGASVAYMTAKEETGADEDKMDTILVSGRYNMGAGVDAFASFGYVDYDDGTQNGDANNKAAVVATGIALTF
jgi:predicted porin